MKGVCPYCGIYTVMHKVPLVLPHPWDSSSYWNNELNLYISKCLRCNEIAI